MVISYRRTGDGKLPGILNLISELFRRNGYELVDKNRYDKKGGDIDLIFECFAKETLMYDVFESSGTKTPHIYVQAKKKTGKDYGDIVGVEQLALMKDCIKEKNAVLMVINLADSFTEDARTKAEEEGIILIDGMTFASLLVRYGVTVL